MTTNQDVSNEDTQKIRKQQLKKIKNDKYMLKYRSKLVCKILYYKNHYKQYDIPHYYFQTKYIEETELLQNIEWIRSYLIHKKLGIEPPLPINI